MNTSSPDQYQRWKPHYSDATALRPMRNPGEGTATLLDSLIAYVDGKSLRTWTTAEIANAFTNEVAA